MSLMTVLLFGAGVVLLIWGADLLVRGAAHLAALVGISPLVIGLTVVALGTSAPELAVIGRRLADLLPTVEGQPLQPERVPLGSTMRIALRNEDGLPRTVVATRCLLLGRPGVAREYVLLLRDVSDEVAVAQLKEAFLANITHEFQTPLASQLASLELLREEEAALAPAERAGLVETVYAGTRRLQHLVGNLLDSASLQAGYFRVEPELSDLRPLVAEAVATVEPVARQRGQTRCRTWCCSMSRCRSRTACRPVGSCGPRATCRSSC